MFLGLALEAAAQDFVPFVIPAEPSPKSLIAFSAKPIDARGPRVTAEGMRFYCDGTMMRFWGVNFSFGANFPSRATAAQMARRLAAAGVNSVRLHHMDTSDFPAGIWDPKNPAELSAEALDRLDYLIDQLAKNGVWVDLNLHVGRAHSRFLDIEKPNTEYDKIVGIFTPALIEAQRKYARALLSRANKYRGVRYADDPAVALVEISNEDSFFMWDGEQKLRTLPPYYRGLLQRQFGDWLIKRYGSDEKLRAAWSEGASALGENMLHNSQFRLGDSADRADGWVFERHEGAAMAAKPLGGGAGIRLEITRRTAADWHLQLNQPGLEIRRGQYYTVAFRARSDRPRTLAVGVMQAHAPWENLGLHQNVDLAPEWKEFRFGWKAKADDANARLNFTLGAADAPVEIAAPALRTGGCEGLSAEESAEKGSVALFGASETETRTRDRLRFLCETEKAYFDGMRAFIKNDLGCKAPVTGTIVFGPCGLYAQSGMDFVDAHAYWNHPHFPNRPWDPGDWIVEQKAMVDDPKGGTLFELALQRLAGKPFTVTEYNHPAPNDYQAECVPMVAAYGAAQGWDGIWLYSYSHNSDRLDDGYFDSYFDIHANPAKWGFVPAGAAIFREHGSGSLSDPLSLLPTPGGWAKGAQRSTANTLHWAEFLPDMLLKNSGFRGVGLAPEDFLKKRISVGLPLGLGNGAGGLKEVLWDVSAMQKKSYCVLSSGAEVYCGYAAGFAAKNGERILIGKPNFTALTITPLDGKAIKESKRMLVTACGRAENTAMEFSKDRRTVGRSWGRAPARIEAVTGTVQLDGDGWRCHALGPSGEPSAGVELKKAGAGTWELEMSPRHGTMWYLLERN